MIKLTKSILMLILFFVLVACGSKAIYQKYYIVDFPKPEADTNTVYIAASLSPASCEILPVDVSAPYAKDRIALRQKSHELVYYSFHRWAVKPDRMLSQLIENYIDEQNLFNNVASRYWKEIPDYQLRTKVYKLEVFEDEEFRAHLDVDFTLIKNKTNHEVVFHKAERFVELENRNINEFAQTISDLMLAELQILSWKISNYLKSENPQ